MSCAGLREPPIPSSSEAPPSSPAPPCGQPAPHGALLVGRPREALAQLRILGRRLAPALDPSGGLEPRDRGHEVRAGQVVGGRERLAGTVVRSLFRDRRTVERAAANNAEKRPRGAPELLLDQSAVIVHGLRS